MTRINVGVCPSELSNRHLIAEHREIKRIPNCIAKGRFSMKGQPKSFCLGAGHVKFFYDKLGYLLKRYRVIHRECLTRGFNVQDYSGAWANIPKEFMGDYQPTEGDRELIINRIKERS